MALGVLNNLSAIYAENNLNNTSNSLQKVLEQLSSGSRINSGADDSAGLSLVNGLEANKTALTQSATNATEGVGLLQVADGALSQVTSLLDRATTLATEASNGTLNSTQLGAANQEYQSILSEITNIGQTTTYNQETVFNGTDVAIYTGDSSAAGSSIDQLHIRSLSASSVGDTGGKMAYSSGSNSVFINLSSSTKNAQASDTLNTNGATTIDVNYLVKGANGAANTASTSITVGTGTSYANTADGLISAINNAGLGLTASFSTQANAGVTGGGTQTGIEITGGMVSAGVDPSLASSSGDLNQSGIPANELLTQGQTVTVKVGDQTAAAITISPTVNTLQELASAINTAANNGGSSTPSQLVKASVVTNGDGTQSLSLSDAAGQGALSVTTTSGTGALTPVFSTPTIASNAVDLNSSSVNTTGTAAVTAVKGSATVGTGSVSTDSSLSGTFVVTNAPASGTATTETFVMGGSGGTDAGNTGKLSSNTFTVNGNSLANLKAAINGQKNAGAGSLGLGVTDTDGANGTTAFTLTGASTNTVTISTAGAQYTNTLTGGTPALSSAAGATANIASVNVAQSNSNTDAYTGSIVIQESGATHASTFVMGSGTDNNTNAASGGVAAYTYYTQHNGGTALTAGQTAAGDTANNLGGLKDTINNELGATVSASISSTGLSVASKTDGDSVTATASLTNTNQSLSLYTPTLAQSGDYSTALLAVSSGSAVTGSIGSTDTLTGTLVLTNGGVNDTFVMSNNANGTNATGIDSTVNSGNIATGGGNIYYVGNNKTAGDLATAINAVVTGEGAGSGVQLNAQAGPSGGVYLQSTAVDDGTTFKDITMSGNIAVAQAASTTSNVSGVKADAGTASTVTVAPTGGTINTTDVMTGSITLTNTPPTGSAVTETFKMGTTANDGTASKGTLSNGTFTVNGNTLADLQNAVNSQTSTTSNSMNLGLTAVASTNGLTVSTSTNNGNAVTATDTLVDTTQGTNSSISMGSYASLNDAVSGDFTIKVGTADAQTVNITAGSTVQGMIDQINGTTTTGGVTTSTHSYGVTATWVAPTSGNNFGSIELTSNTPGTAGNITKASEAITDTPTSATLSYTANSAYNTGISGTISDSTTGQTAATFSTDAKSSSGIATISYTDGAGVSLSTTDLSNETDAKAALNSLNSAITAVAAQDGYIGAQINTLNAVSQVLSTQQENVQSAQNAVQATDYASATSDMSKYEILSQTGIAALAQANSVQQEVTKLLQ
jgi:flagellin